MQRMLDLATLALTWLMLGVLALLSIRGMLDAPSAAASFGVPIDDPAAALYQLVYRSRNLVIAVAGIVFASIGQWRSLAILTTIAIALPAFDIAFLMARGTPVAAVHPTTLVVLLVVAALLWRRVSRMAGETTTSRQ